MYFLYLFGFGNTVNGKQICELLLLLGYDLEFTDTNIVVLVVFTYGIIMILFSLLFQSSAVLPYHVSAVTCALLQNKTLTCSRGCTMSRGRPCDTKMCRASGEAASNRRTTALEPKTVKGHMKQTLGSSIYGHQVPTQAPRGPMWLRTVF